MRFSASAIIVTLFALGAAASPVADKPGCKDCPPPPKDDGPVTVQSCGNGDFHCCDQLQSASASSSQGILGLLAAAGQAAVDPATTLGIDCTSVGVFGGATGAKCQKTAACCTGQNYNGFIVLGCNPVNFGI